MLSDYNEISGVFEKSTHLGFRKYIEEPSFFHNAPDFNNKRVLDLACGTGRFAREIKARGAKEVLGVDLSQVMLDVAQAQEREEPQGIDYLCQDVLQLGQIDEQGFDIVSAVYLNNYASSPQEFMRFCDVFWQNLKPGGYFVGMTNNPNFSVALYGSLRKYGVLVINR